MSLALLLACTAADPLLVAAIESPAPGAVVALGEPVTLAGAATRDGAPVQAALAWSSSLEGAVASGPSAGWVPGVPGAHALTLTATHQGEEATASVELLVQVPAEPAFDHWSVAPGASFNGLSVAGDGTLYAASSAGLVIVDDAVRTLGTPDGLLADAVTAVLAHPDGTIWLGYDGAVGQQLGADLAPLRDLAFTQTGEITSIFRLGVQPWGAGVGDVWMGTNEGVCVWDHALDQLVEHGHPTHPHGATRGLAFTGEGDVWNGDAHQLSRWRYAGDANVFGAWLETVATWPVEPGVELPIADLAAEGSTVWVASPRGLARIDVAEPGFSEVELLGAPLPPSAAAVRVDPRGRLWIGTDLGLFVWDGVEVAQIEAVPAVSQLAVDRRTDPPAIWAATSSGIYRVIR